MIDTLYIERQIREHPRVAEILARFKKADVVEIERYGEVFNRKAQDFRLQKQKPSLILARKHKNFVLPAPVGYGIGGEENFYFSHMLNCVYDCRYCFLQGMYRSAHYVLFVNNEDFAKELTERMAELTKPGYFFSGYDCDSLALEPVSAFGDFFLDAFARWPEHFLELRTKSTQVRGLLARESMSNVIVAFSLSPENIAVGLEHKAPPLVRRLEAMAKVAQAGWPIGLRFDPMVYHRDYQRHYAELVEQVFAGVDAACVHSVSVGGFRLPETFFNNIVRRYPHEKLFAGPLCNEKGMVGYGQSREEKMIDFMLTQLRRHLPEEKLFPCVYG